MATSSVASLVLGTPELAAAIDSCTQLMPGVPASKENVQPMWDYMCKQQEDGGVWMMTGEHTEVMFSCSQWGKKIGRRLSVRVEGPIEPISGASRDPFHRAWVDDKRFDWSIDGFVEALAWTRAVVDGVNRGDFCSRCRVDGVDIRPGGVARLNPCKKLRSHPLPYCVRCSMEVALGEPPQKKARQ